MAAVTERLIGAFPAGAEGDPVTDFIGLAIGGFDGDAAPHPDGTRHTLRNVSNQPDGWLEIRLDSFARLVPDDKPSRRAIAGFFDSRFSGFRISGLLGQFPGAAGPVAKASRGTQVFDVSQCQIGTAGDNSLLQIWFSAGRFGTVEFSLSMGTVTERLALRLPATAK